MRINIYTYVYLIDYLKVSD